eukprot:CAMPEP_0196703034 /NCGR_PEP_ID=MMETSP1090-20130531/54979_1 /TAXON_ID=37098 /ORGANISM="Isochrysis sp, Strain CCMP1244" /LENGTH=73 /DNA_ID=CAMNT_0042042875 /DNA_START=98 /DNA_END=316 /DNA_ORIENTATION=+
MKFFSAAQARLCANLGVLGIQDFRAPRDAEGGVGEKQLDGGEHKEDGEVVPGDSLLADVPPERRMLLDESPSG